MLQPNYLGFIAKALALPFASLGWCARCCASSDLSAIDLGVGLAESLPSGLYYGGGIERYVAEVLTDGGRSNDFRVLDAELYLTATDLDTSRADRLRRGRAGATCRSPRRSQCSTALPIVYKPVELNGRQLVDGGIRSTTNVDVAVERGRSSSSSSTRWSPTSTTSRRRSRPIFGSRVRRVSDMGLPAIGNQAFRLIAHARLHQAVEQWQEKYPGVDILLLEPEPTDELMFGTPIMDYSRRLDIARHGFESVTATLAQDYERYAEIAAKHGLEISERRLRRVVEQGRGGRARETLRLAPGARADDLVLLRQSARRQSGDARVRLYAA